jgi:hypothetical protein
MVNTIEVALAQKMQEALTAYGLAPNEAAAEIRQKLSVGTGDRDSANFLHDDSLYIDIGARRIHDAARKQAVRTILTQFINDFVAASGIDGSSEYCVHPVGDAKNGYIFGSNDGGMPEFRCKDVAKASTREGRDRAVDDVWYGLDSMIKAKQQSWAKRA